MELQPSLSARTEQREFRFQDENWIQHGTLYRPKDVTSLLVACDSNTTEAVNRAVRREREACARIADSRHEDVAELIRGRGE